MANDQKQSFLKNIISFSVVTWISFALGFLSSPIATRLFEPAELGKVTMFLTYTSLMSSICYLGLDQLLVRFFRQPPEGVSRKALFTFCLGIAALASVLMTAVLTLMWQRLSIGVTGQPSLGIFLCLCIFSFAQVIFRFIAVLYRMEQNVLLYTIHGVLQVFITKLAYLSMGFASGRGEPAVILLTVLMVVFSLTFLFFQRKSLSFSALKEVNKPFLKESVRFALPLVPLAFLDWLNNNVNVVALESLLGLEAAAIFASALGLASTINLVKAGFNTYWAPYVLDNYDTQNGRFYTVHRMIACLLTLFGLTITLLQAPVFLLLGRSYRSSAVFLPFLFLSPICFCLGETTDLGITIAKKTHWTTIIFLVTSILNLSLCYLLIPSLGMAGAAMASAFTAVVVLFLRTAVGQHYYKAINSWKYIFLCVGLMLVASFGNLLLTDYPVIKYALLVALEILACLLFLPELKTLLSTVKDLLRGLLAAVFLRRTAPAAEAEKRILLVGDANSFWIKRYVQFVLHPAGYSTVLFPIYGWEGGFAEDYAAMNVTVYKDEHRLPISRHIPKVRMWRRIAVNARSLKALGPYAAVHCHYLSRRDLALGRQVAKGSGAPLVATFWGSDLLRVEDKTLRAMSRYLRRCHAVTVFNREHIDRIRAHCGEDVARITRVLDFGEVVFPYIDQLADADRAKLKAQFGVAEDKLLVCVGSSASAAQQQLPALEAIARMDESQLSRLAILLKHTYCHDDPDTEHRVKELAASLPCQSVVLTQFQSEEESARLCRAADVYLHTIRTDAFSSAMKEYLYAGARVAHGDWLVYPALAELDIRLRTFSAFDQLPGLLADALSGAWQPLTADERDRLASISAWSSLAPQWAALYGPAHED